MSVLFRCDIKWHVASCSCHLMLLFLTPSLYPSILSIILSISVVYEWQTLLSRSAFFFLLTLAVSKRVLSHPFNNVRSPLNLPHSGPRTASLKSHDCINSECEGPRCHGSHPSLQRYPPNKAHTSSLHHEAYLEAYHHIL